MGSSLQGINQKKRQHSFKFACKSVKKGYLMPSKKA